VFIYKKYGKTKRAKIFMTRKEIIVKKEKEEGEGGGGGGCGQ
jgi:hypothetical protein